MPIAGRIEERNGKLVYVDLAEEARQCRRYLRKKYPPQYNRAYVAEKKRLMQMGVCSGRYLFGEGNHSIECDGRCDFCPDVVEYSRNMSLTVDYEGKLI